jgi:hypothetical protein
MESNPRLELAFDFLESTGTNVFLTGKAGTGKTTFLQQLKGRTSKRMVVLAPTGVAAINAGGVTIHSFFQIPFGPYLPTTTAGTGADNPARVYRFSREKISIIRGIDLLVIDEISMVRADLLDAVDDVLRRYRDRNRPFGGVQLLLIGDMQQLAPVAREEEWAVLRDHYESVYFFHARALRATRYVTIELVTVYRQKDDRFIELLNRVRENRADEETLATLNRRYLPGFTPDEAEGYITLTTHNQQARAINEARMEALDAPSRVYPAEVKGAFPDYAFPTDRELLLKPGAQVMFVKNDSSPAKRYYNGKIGEVLSVSPEVVEVRGKEDGEITRVTREAWQNTKYAIDPGSRALIESVEGTFRQFPLKSAWAITIHKSQGLTFERAVIDPHAAFAHGQVYVALSRCRSLDGMVLGAPLHAAALKKDATIDAFSAGIEEPTRDDLERERGEFYKTLLLELFDHGALVQALDHLHRVAGEHLYRLYPTLVQRCREASDNAKTGLLEVARRFRAQLSRLVDATPDAANDATLAGRVESGRAYFQEHAREIVLPLLEEGMPDVDDEEAMMLVARAMESLAEEYRVKMETLEAAAEGFSIKGFLSARAKARVPPNTAREPGGRRSTQREKSRRGGTEGDIACPALYEALRAWRRETAEMARVPAYAVMQQRALVGVCNARPRSMKELLEVNGIGKVVAERHGQRVLEIVDAYRARE